MKASNSFSENKVDGEVITGLSEWREARKKGTGRDGRRKTRRWRGREAGRQTGERVGGRAGPKKGRGEKEVREKNFPKLKVKSPQIKRSYPVFSTINEKKTQSTLGLKRRASKLPGPGVGGGREKNRN